MKRNNKRAISLIVLVVTIIVLAILATAIILSLSNTNILSQVSSTVFKSDMANYKETYELYVTNKLAENAEFDRSGLNVTFADNPTEFEKIFGDKVPDKYKNGLKVVKGKLVYETDDDAEKDVLEELVIASTSLPSEVEKMVGTVPIPKGFYHVGGTASDGLVISDNEADVTNGLNGNTAGNQFVWVPVTYTKTEGETADADGLYPSFKGKFKRGTIKSEGNIYQMTAPLNSSYTEPYSYEGAQGYTNERAEYIAMMKSVQEYGGFYIARFEAGDKEATDRGAPRNDITTVRTVVSKKGVQVYNYVPWGLSSNQIMPIGGAYYVTGTLRYTNMEIAGAVYLSKNMATQCGYTSVVSTLCYGVQWDAVMNFIADEKNISDSSTWGNYSGTLQTTGSNSAWQAKHIYDLAGNVMEWTMEANNSGSCVGRGGHYNCTGSGDPASTRGDGSRHVAHYDRGFRPALYIIAE